MTEPTATPRPWELDVREIVGHQGLEHVGTVADEANGRLIVQAVNAYKPLRDALELVTRRFRQAIEGKTMRDVTEVLAHAEATLKETR